MVVMCYGYNPYQGTEQFYECELPSDHTAPITRWLRDHTGVVFHDFLLSDGHIIRAITQQTATECYPSSIMLPD